jgi:hypothetical protein
MQSGECFASSVTGMLSGFDRVVARGHIRSLSYVDGFATYLNYAGVLLKDFGTHVEAMSKQLKAASTAQAQHSGRPVRFLNSPTLSKETAAREIATVDGIKSGLIGVLTSVEPCRTFDIHRDRKAGRLQLVQRVRKCLYLYHYWIDPAMGLMSARIQSWFPFSIQICLNGREWLARQMDAHGITYERRENCFVRISDLASAQQLMNGQLKADWPALFAQVASRLNPAHRQMFGSYHANYYWSIYQSEWASDLMFKSPDELAQLYPQLTAGAISSFRARDVFCFLGKRLLNSFEGEQTGSYCTRQEGVRVKYSINHNSVKMYDKQQHILRIETTLNNVADLRTFDPECRSKWRPMRKGISDLHRRAEISQNVNQRFLASLQSLNVSTTVLQLVSPVCKSVRLGQQAIRGLRPWAHNDQQLLRAVASGQFMINGMRNRDLVALLYPGQHKKHQHKRLAAKVSRQLRMLRAHGILQRVPHTHRYMLSGKGREICTAILQTQELSISRLTKMAA